MAFDIEAFHAEAVRTPSHHDEGVAAMCELLVETLERAGHDARIDDAGNLLATRGGEERDESEATDRSGPHIVLNTHVDTVAPHVSYERDGDVVSGRGACDAKGPLAALLAAFLRVDPDEGRLTLAITPDEETLQTGAAHLGETLSADGYIVGEPTDLDVCIAARGQCEATVTVEGEGGHAASVETDRNAVFGLEHVLEVLRRYDEAPATDDEAPATDDEAPTTAADPVLGSPKLTPTMLDGGEAPNRIPERCRLTIDRRSVPPESADSFRADLERTLGDAMPDDLSASVELIRPDTPFPRPFVTDEDAPLVRILREESGGDVRSFGAATEAGVFAADAPTVVFGPGVLADDVGGVAHSEREYVRVSDVHAAADALEAALGRLF